MPRRSRLAIAWNSLCLLVVFQGLCDVSDPGQSSDFTSAPRLLSVQPSDGAKDLPPVVEFTARITNGTTQVVEGTVGLRVDGSKVMSFVTQQSDLIIVTYTNEALFAPRTKHLYELTYSDNATPANTFTNRSALSAAYYRDIRLPEPLYFENFDSTPEGALPAGWAEISFSEIQMPEFDLGNLDSASYATWTVVDADRFTGSFVTYSDPGSAQAWKEDYHRVLSSNPWNVVNGRSFNEPLAKGRVLFGNSGYRNGRSQVLYAFTPDYDLSGKRDVYVSYHSLWEQNQDSMGAVEYSIDEGKTWLPIVYMLDGPDVIRADTGQFDAVKTFTREHGDSAHYTDPMTGEEKGVSYGDFIGAAIHQNMAAFISVRVNDNPVESKRIELFRLPKADDQPKVRFRFAHAGTDSWYFGIDNFGLYSIPPTSREVPKLDIAISKGSVTIAWPDKLMGVVLESADAVADAEWTQVSGVLSNGSIEVPASRATFYRLRLQ